MNYAVQSASTFASSVKRASFSTSFLKPITPSPSPLGRRITINVGGELFQTYEETLARYPSSLLGSPVRRRQFYDFSRGELVFPHRNKEVFNSILFFYQAKILSRPEHVPHDIFAEEIKFFDLTSYSSDCRTTDEENVTLTFPENTLRNRLWNFLENPKTKLGRTFAKLNFLLVFAWIVMNCVETLVEPGVSMPSRTANHSNSALGEPIDCKKDREEGAWFIIDTLFVLWFSIDYVLHILSAPNLIRYIFSALGLVDFTTIFPYYLRLLLKHTGHSLSNQWKVVRFLRVFRLFKASRYSSSFQILVGSLTSSARDSPVWLILVIMHIFCFSSILYFVEMDDKDSQFSNIPEAMWFVVITMCAVGYGDIVPESSLGKFVTAMAAVSGIVIVYCIPAPTLKSNFNRLNALYKNKKIEKKRLKANGLHDISQCS